MTFEQALARLQGQCGKAEYCCGQIRQRLQRWSSKEVACGRSGFSADEIEEMIASLVEERFVDDSRFAGAYVRDKARFSKWGSVKIAYNLKRLGVAPSVVKEALQENASCFGEQMLRELLQKKWDSFKEDEPQVKKREKLVRFALQRGFDYGQIMELINDFR